MTLQSGRSPDRSHTDPPNWTKVLALLLEAAGERVSSWPFPVSAGRLLCSAPGPFLRPHNGQLSIFRSLADPHPSAFLLGGPLCFP